MKKWFKNNLLYIIGASAGAIVGYFYYLRVGCASGTCLITSSPHQQHIVWRLNGWIIIRDI